MTTESVAEQQEPAQEPAEAPETPAEPEPEPEAEPETPEPETHPDEQALLDSRAAEQGRKRIDRAVTSMVKTLHEVLADEAEFLEPCPRCAGDFPGLVWKPNVKQVLPDVRAAVMISMGEDPDPQYRQDPRANTCATCDGWGKVATGSKVNREINLRCEECNGRGWIGPRVASIASTPEHVEQPQVFTNGDTAHETPETDPWGRVRGEALYGVMPGFES